MNKKVNFFLKRIGVPKLYFGIKKIIRLMIEQNIYLHTISSNLVFKIRNMLKWNIHRVPFIIAKHLDKNSVIIDCGANIGAIVRPLLKYDSEIYCFEPNPVAFKQLALNLGSVTNLHLINKAVGVESKTARLYRHKEAEHNELLFSVSSSLLANKPNVDNNHFYEVEVINFIDFVDSLDQNVEILKVDIEGAEVELINAILDSGLYKKIK